MVEPRFRQATTDDIPELVWLESIARRDLVDQRGGDLWMAANPAQSPGWPAVAADGVWVGTIDDVAVGYLRFAVDAGVLFVRDVFVHPAARELGFGDGLLAAAIEAGRGAGASRVEAVALPGDRDTKNLYERAGITAKRIIVSAAI